MPDIFAVFNPSPNWKKGDPLADPVVTIVLNEIFANARGRITISQELTSDSEIDYACDYLRNDIEAVRKEAKRVLRKAKEAIRASYTK